MSDNHDFNLVSLSNLPSDIVRRIIRVGVESIECMKQITPRWNDLAVEHLSMRKHLPTIKRFRWGRTENSSYMKIRIAERFENYFGVENFGKQIQRFEDAKQERILDRHWKKCNGHLIADLPKDKLLSNSISRLFNRCSIVEKLEFEFVIHQSKFKNYHLRNIRNVVGDVIIEELHFVDLQCFNKHSASIVLESLRLFTVHSLVLPITANNVKRANVDVFAAFLAQAVLVVPSIELNFYRYPLSTYDRAEIAAELSEKAGVEAKFNKAVCTVTARKDKEE